MFLTDPFDVAPHASRHARASWLVLGAGLLFAACCSFLLRSSVLELNQAQALEKARHETLRARAKAEASARLRQSDPAALERSKAQETLRLSLRMSWTGLFDALELAANEVDGGTSVVSLVPVSVRPDAAQVDITALAVSSQIMLDYLRSLEENAQVRQAQLTMQQPTASGGAEVIRFQFTLLWDPRGDLTAQLPQRDQPVVAVRQPR